MGTFSFLDRFFPRRRDAQQNLIDEMVEALQHLAQRRVGALIVFERRIRLTDIISGGTRVDGIISQPLIENIFEPNTPLHDGAVVIRNNRVEAAACLLPVSNANTLGRELGTRHRAGLGVTEETDAVVLIVSEETGVISTAYGGRLTRYLDETKIRQLLDDLFNNDSNDDTDDENRPSIYATRGKEA